MSIIGGFRVNYPYVSGAGFSDGIYNVVSFPISGIKEKGGVAIAACLFDYDYATKTWVPCRHT